MHARVKIGVTTLRKTSPSGKIVAFIVDLYKITMFFYNFGRLSAVLLKFQSTHLHMDGWTYG